MGYKNKSLVTKDQTISSSSNCESLSDAMLVFTMNIIGLPVDVHVKDGSVFSGIFYTASVDDRFGFVLKQARMTKKGIGHINVGKKALIDTLVVQSKDLVQVIAKGVTLPGDGDNGKITGEDEEAITPKVCCSENRSVDAEQVNQSRQAGDNNSKGKADDCRQKFEFHSKPVYHHDYSAWTACHFNPHQLQQCQMNAFEGQFHPYPVENQLQGVPINMLS